MATQAVVGIQLNEEKLIRAGQRGDEQAVEALFRRYHRPLFQTALAGAGEHGRRGRRPAGRAALGVSQPKAL